MICALLAGAPALAKDAPAAKAEEAKDVLWGKACDKIPDAKPESGKEVCAIQQFILAQPQNKQLLLAQFIYVGPRNKPRLILSAPLGVLLTAGVSLSIDGKKSVTSPFQVCNPNACQSFLDMDGAALDQFRKGKILTVRYFLGEQKPLELPVKLDGLDAALKTIAPR